jgi:hypothetical protein
MQLSQARVARRNIRLKKLIASGTLEVTKSKAALQMEAELLCCGHPIKRIAAGVSGLD